MDEAPPPRAPRGRSGKTAGTQSSAEHASAFPISASPQFTLFVAESSSAVLSLRSSCPCGTKTRASRMPPGHETHSYGALLLLDRQGHRVHTVPHARRLRAVVEDVSQVSAASGASH